MSLGIKLFLYHFLPPAVITLMVVVAGILAEKVEPVWLWIPLIWAPTAIIGAWKGITQPVWHIHKP